jgi:hypothetical protein
MSIHKHLLVIPCVAAFVFAGYIATTPFEEQAGEESEALTGSCAGTSTGPCAGQPIDTAVRCATALGARVLSYYRSPAQQECVRRQNHCTDRCTGSAGCARETAGCTTSPHTQCHAVDLVANGAPLSQAQLRACGLAKTTAPHLNHYDYVGGGAAPASDPEPVPASPGKTPAGSGGGTCRSATLGEDVAPGTCVQRADSSWYVCEASDLTAWPAVSDPTDPQCTSCPQLAGGLCRGGKGGK